VKILSVKSLCDFKDMPLLLDPIILSHQPSFAPEIRGKFIGLIKLEVDLPNELEKPVENFINFLSGAFKKDYRGINGFKTWVGDVRLSFTYLKEISNILGKITVEQYSKAKHEISKISGLLAITFSKVFDRAESVMVNVEKIVKKRKIDELYKEEMKFQITQLIWGVIQNVIRLCVMWGETVENPRRQIQEKLLNYIADTLYSSTKYNSIILG